MRALVLMIGRPFHWGHIAYSLEKAGYETFLVEYRPGVFTDFTLKGVFFDLVISTRHGLSHVHNEIYTGPWREYGRFNFKAIIYQYDDVFSEVMAYRQLHGSFAKNGFSIKIYIWIYCKKSYELIKKHNPDLPVFFCYTPLYQDLVILPAARSGPSTGAPSPEKSITPVSDFLGGFDAEQLAGLSGRIVYFGSYYSSFYNEFALSEGAEGFAAGLVRNFKKNFPNGTRWDFMEEVFDEKISSCREEDIVRTTFLSWYYSYEKQKEERLSIVRTVREAYGDALFLAGPGWSDAGLASLPANHVEPLVAYSRAAVCLDIGSQFIESCLYQRILEILLAGGTLLHRRIDETPEVFGEFQQTFSFDGPEDVVTGIARLQGGDGKENASRLRERLCRTFLDPERCIRTIVEAIAV